MPLGYVEAKDIGVDLRKVERTDQLKRYKAALPNLILTDYLEFRHFVNGEHRGTSASPKRTETASYGWTRRVFRRWSGC